MVEPPRVARRMEILTGAVGRRRWSADEKARILEEVLAPGAVVSEIARRHGMTPQHLFTWRRQAREAQAATAPIAMTFVPAVIEASADATPVAAAREPRTRRARRRSAASGIELEIGGVMVRVGAGASPQAIAAVIGALKAGA